MCENMTTEDIAKHKLIVSEGKKTIKQSYLCIKEKIRNVRQNYRNALVQGGRSGKMLHLPLTLYTECSLFFR